MDELTAAIRKEFDDLKAERETLDPNYQAAKEALDQKQADLVQRASEINAMVSEVVASLNGKVVDITKKTRKPLTKVTVACTKCGREFFHPLHLGRHMSATHGKKSKQRKSA